MFLYDGAVKFSNVQYQLKITTTIRPNKVSTKSLNQNNQTTTYKFVSNNINHLHAQAPNDPKHAKLTNTYCVNDVMRILHIFSLRDADMNGRAGDKSIVNIVKMNNNDTIISPTAKRILSKLQCIR